MKTLIKLNFVASFISGVCAYLLMNREEISRLGASLRRINQNLLTHNPNSALLRVWYQGEEPYFDLFVELENQKIRWFQLTLRGKAVFWEQNSDRWHTGDTNELQSHDLTFYAASKVIDTSDRLDQDFIDLVSAIIKTRQGETIFDQLMTLFQHQHQQTQISG